MNKVCRKYFIIKIFDILASVKNQDTCNENKEYIVYKLYSWTFTLQFVCNKTFFKLLLSFKILYMKKIL